MTATTAPPVPETPRRRVRTPTVLQMEAVECGAASLAIVLEHHGRVKPLEELRIACGVSRDGSKASNLMKAARSLGLEAKGYRRKPEDLLDASLPAILHWNFNHFLVLEGFGRNGQVFLNDPADGPRTVTWQELDDAFTGVVLEFSPGPDFEPGGERPSLIKSLLDRVRGSEKAIVFALIAGLFLVVPGLVIPVFSQVFVDRILVQGAVSWVRPLLLGMALTLGLRMGLSALQNHFLLRLETKISIATSSRFLRHILHLPVEFFTQRYGGEIAGRVSLNDQVARFLSTRLAAHAIDAMMVVFFALMMIAYDWVLTLVAVVAVAIIVFTTRLVNRKRVDGNRRLLQEQGKAAATLMGGLSTIETLKASGGESDLFARWAGYNAKYLNAQQNLAVTTQSFLTVPPLLQSLTFAVVLGLGAYRVIEGDLTMGMLVAFQSLTASFLTPVTNLVGLASTLQEMEGNMNKIDDVLRYDADPRALESGTTAADGEAPAKLLGHVELRGVSFGYSPLDPPLIEDFNLKLTPGKRVALVGPSGCGKSTVAKLVTGLADPWDGEILFDGIPRDETTRATLTSSVAMVDQDVAMYEGTIRENLTLWDETVPDPELVRSARDAMIHDDIAARGSAYDGKVTEGGANFSGGQRQRMEIARALVTNPRVLVLDEATSALDTVTEQAIDRRLRVRGCTCIIIAHRLSTIRDADEIIVLDRGKVVQRGTHEDLMDDESGIYATLAKEA